MTMRIQKAKPQADFADSSDHAANMTEQNNNDKNGKQKHQKYFDPMAVTWMEKYSDQMDRIWRRLPNFVGSAIATCAIFLLGATMRGEWLIILVHVAKHYGYGVSDENDTSINDGNNYSWEKISLENFYLKNVIYFWLASVTVSYTMYCGIGGFVHWYFYYRQRDKAEEWKCQPKKWLTPELEKDEIILGSTSLLCVTTLSSCLACYLMNGGPSKMYYKLDEYTWTYWFVSWPALYIYMDYVTYWLHRAYHTPFLYQNFHKLHHKYKTPTVFSVTAMHPVELISIEVISIFIPIFLIPMHWVPVCAITLYNYYHGIIDHSGVTFKSYWWQPWQPDAIFHDNHHQYFHVNFGFNCLIWDKIHGTYRKKDRIYTEDIYYGRGKSLSEASESEIKTEIEQRNSENPRAYRGDGMVYRLSENELKSKKH